jgi:membrane associated rhomboid family serine protease
MCSNCGALVGAGETTCSLCGEPKVASATPQAQAPSPPVHDGETLRFARTVLSRPYIFTIIFLIANIFIFLLMWSSGGLNSGALWQPPFTVLVAYGAKLNYLINEYHQWWRFVTPVFIHIGIIHLLVNMYGLWIIGPYVERLYGSAKFVVLWVGTGVAGVIASYLSLQPKLAVGPVGRFIFTATDGPSAGASGALFGLIGVLFVFGIKFRRELPEGFKRAFGTGLLPVILLNLLIGYLGRDLKIGNTTIEIGNAAHLGGLFSGALFALVIGYKRPGERASVAVFWHILQIAALALVVVSFVMVALNFNKPYSDAVGGISPSLTGNGYDVKPYLDALNGGQTTFINALMKDDASGIEESIQALENAPTPDKTAAALRDELKSLLVRARDFLSTPVVKRTKQRARAGKAELVQALNAWVEKRDQWVNTEGKNYGIFIPESTPPAEDSSKEK